MPSGRPLDGEFAAYTKPDIQYVEGDDIVASLEAQGKRVEAFILSLTDQAVAGKRYAAGKWTVKGEKVCLRQTHPPTLPISFCQVLPADPTAGVDSKDLLGTKIHLKLVNPEGRRAGQDMYVKLPQGVATAK